MSDIAERLRVLASLRPRDRGNDAVDDIMSEAADEIDRLNRELAEARVKELEEAAKVARTWLEDWGCDLQHTADEYREAMRTGRFANRRIDAGQAKLYASQFQERADAVYDCGKQVHDAIRALKEKP